MADAHTPEGLSTTCYPEGYLLAFVRREGVLDLDDSVLVGGDCRVVDDRLAHDLVGLLTVYLCVAQGDVEVVVREFRATEGANLPAASAPAVEVLHCHLDERLCVGVVRAAADDDRDDLLESLFQDRKSTRLNSSHSTLSRMPSSA